MKKKSKFGASSALKFKVLNLIALTFTSVRHYDFLIGLNNRKTYLILTFC